LNRLHLYLLASILTLAGMALFVYKWLFLDFPLVPGTEAYLWSVEARVSFLARNKPIKLTLNIPKNTPLFLVMNENFISRGYGLVTKKSDDNREAVWSTRRARGRQTLYYQAVIRRLETMEKVKDPPPFPIERPGYEGPYLEAAETLINEIRERSADQDSFVVELIKRVKRPAPGENLKLLLGEDDSPAEEVEAMVRILAQAGIAARSVHGIRLEAESRNAPVRVWLEVYDANQWRSYDPASGGERISEDMLPWWRGDLPMAEVKDGSALQVTLSVSQNREEAIHAAIERTRIKDPLFLEFSLLRLPLGTQSVYRVLFLIPLGAILVVLFRNIVGLNTFGTFMPVLMALAFRETRLLWGVVLFSLVVALGLAFRFYLDRLKLLLVPRLAAVLIMVVLTMALMSVVLHKLGLEQGLSVALFPMVILTMTIERMSIVWEELGPADAMKQGLGSLFVAALAYAVMNNEVVEHVIFFFPELNLVLLAVTLLLGRYTGYRLFELRRFKAMSEGAP